jgi:mono/diheme cytochrome c family protein
MWYCVLALAGSLAIVQAQHPTTPGAHHHPEAAKIQNPVTADAASIAAGKQAFEKNCANCHGKTGVGDGPMGSELNPKPSNLVDAEWKHGSSDGEIFTVIKDGVKGTGMKGFNSKLQARDIWNIVNYLRSLAPAKSH